MNYTGSLKIEVEELAPVRKIVLTPKKVIILAGFYDSFMLAENTEAFKENDRVEFLTRMPEVGNKIWWKQGTVQTKDGELWIKSKNVCDIKLSSQNHVRHRPPARDLRLFGFNDRDDWQEYIAFAFAAKKAIT